MKNGKLYMDRGWEIKNKSKLKLFIKERSSKTERIRDWRQEVDDGRRTRPERKSSKNDNNGTEHCQERTEQEQDRSLNENEQ